MALFLSIIAVAFSASVPAQSSIMRSDEGGTVRQPDFSREFEDLLRLLGQNGVDMRTHDFAAIIAQKQIGDAAIDAFALKLKTSLAHGEIFNALVQDYVTIRNATSSRLTGRVVRIGAAGFKDLQSAIPNLQAGDLVLLPAGAHTISVGPRGGPALTDVALVGPGPEQTTLAGEINAALRVRIEGVRIDCQNDPFVDLRGGSIHLRNCQVFNYNSGAGGSNSIFINDGIALIEQCEFEGASGRQSGRSFGRAFDIRGRSMLYVRQSQFIDNQEIVRATFPAVFDGCISMTADESAWGVMPYPEGRAVLYDSGSVAAPARGPFHSLTVPSDDLAFVRHANDLAAPIDDASRAMIDTLQLHTRIEYWFGLLRHEQPAIRTLAAARISALLPAQVALADGGATAEEVLDEGTGLHKAECEFARLMQWLENHRESLEWDAGAQRFRAKDE